MQNFIEVGSEQACKVVTWIQGDVYHTYCDRYVYPDDYQKAGIVFWVGAAVLTGLVIVLVRRFIFSAFES